MSESRSEAMEHADPAPVLELILAFRRSKTMFTAVSMGVFDLLEKGAAGTMTLAQELGADSGALERLLDACVGLGLIKKDGATYENLRVASAYLTRSSPHTLAGYILYSNQALYPLWENLESAIREGTNRWTQTFGGEGPIFDHFFRTEQAQRDFLGGMNGFGLLSSPAVVAAFDLSRFHRLVDLGGATGHLALAACERYPGLSAAVFDLPSVIPHARAYVECSPHRNRLGLIAGDFFSDQLPEADLFSVGRILHDWSEEKIRTLLWKIWQRLPAGGALLIAEKLLDDDKAGPLSAIMQSLSMLVCTEGKERTLAEYTALLREVGFAEVEGRVTSAPLDAVLAVK
jgi:O-methyltransferase domain/Dimerisation domain